HAHLSGEDGIKTPKISKTFKMMLAVTLHNIPEGLACGVVIAGAINGTFNPQAMIVLSIGIAIQNFPEGAIISMPLFAEGKSRKKSFGLGVLSGAVEPLFGALTVVIAALVVPAMPYLLSFAAGAMLYVVVEELIPEMSAGEHSNIGVLAFALGFSVMMALDVALG
ncbi:MAG: ZIP family metal transporter, partial [Clostridia bacterium]|nr:ZIP family metal transporter [Clostridia bacterium]